MEEPDHDGDGIPNFHRERGAPVLGRFPCAGTWQIRRSSCRDITKGQKCLWPGLPAIAPGRGLYRTPVAERRPGFIGTRPVIWTSPVHGNKVATTGGGTSFGLGGFASQLVILSDASIVPFSDDRT